MVGCALGPSRLWFTIGFGILNEVYYPRVDIPQIRDLGFIVAGPDGFWSEVNRNANYRLRLAAPGVPAAEIHHQHPRYVLTLRVTPDPLREVLLIECTRDGDEALRLYALLAPHLGATGYGNFAAAERRRGRRVLWAEQGPFGLALAAADEEQNDAFSRIRAGCYLLRLNPAQMRTMTLVLLVFAGQVTVYVLREQGHFWSSRPAAIMLAATMVDLAIVACLAIAGLLMTPIAPAILGALLAATLTYGLALDFVKVAVFDRLRID
jgi:hypothetical protein